MANHGIPSNPDGSGFLKTVSRPENKNHDQFGPISVQGSALRLSDYAARFYIGKHVLNRLFADYRLVGLISFRISNDGVRPRNRTGRISCD
jgi:hypothetical protein